jgi:hypothetical protein
VEGAAGRRIDGARRRRRPASGDARCASLVEVEEDDAHLRALQHVEARHGLHAHGPMPFACRVAYVSLSSVAMGSVVPCSSHHFLDMM